MGLVTRASGVRVIESKVRGFDVLGLKLGSGPSFSIGPRCDMWK